MDSGTLSTVVWAAKKPLEKKFYVAEMWKLQWMCRQRKRGKSQSSDHMTMWWEERKRTGEEEVFRQWESRSLDDMGMWSEEDEWVRRRVTGIRLPREERGRGRLMRSWLDSGRADPRKEVAWRRMSSDIKDNNNNNIHFYIVHTPDIQINALCNKKNHQ